MSTDEESIDEDIDRKLSLDDLVELSQSLGDGSFPKKKKKQKRRETTRRVRRDLNKLLIYLCKNPQLWINDSIGYGIIHTFDIHIPCLHKQFDQVLNNESIILNDTNLYPIQEMTPNKHGILGLNKPKKIKTIKLANGKDYEIAEKRSMHLTIRTNGKIHDYSKILLLAIHEITHTTCNDIYWKEDNHKYPYGKYHTQMKNWAKDCGIIKN